MQRRRRVPKQGEASGIPKSGGEAEHTPDPPVGYKSPPVSGRWKKGGLSPNPLGRKKGSENLKTLLKRDLAQTYTVVEDGKRKKRTAIAIIVKQAVTDTMKGKVKAFERLVTLIRFTGIFEEKPLLAPEAPVTPEEQAIIDELVASHRRAGT